MIAAPPIRIDPLIAEAQRRARRRRFSIVAAALTLVAVAAALTATLRPSVPATVPARPAWLHDAMARGTLVSLDQRSAVAEFRISCGWHSRRGGPSTKIRPGLYRVALRGATINVEAGIDPRVPGSGVANEMSYSRWERGSDWRGWKAWMAISKTPYLSDGPSTDICGGVLG